MGLRPGLRPSEAGVKPRRGGVKLCCIPRLFQSVVTLFEYVNSYSNEQFLNRTFSSRGKSSTLHRVKRLEADGARIAALKCEGLRVPISRGFHLVAAHHKWNPLEPDRGFEEEEHIGVQFIEAARKELPYASI